MNQSCSPRRDLSNDMSHSPNARRERVDSRLLVVGSQTASLTPDLSFYHNLCYRCPNGSCEPIFDIYISIAFQCYKEHLNVRCFDPYNRTLKFRESRWTPKSPFQECECHPPTLPKVGLRHFNNIFLFKLKILIHKYFFQIDDLIMHLWHLNKIQFVKSS